MGIGLRRESGVSRKPGSLETRAAVSSRRLLDTSDAISNGLGMAQTPARTYLETFDQHTGGWWGWGGNHLGLQALVRENGYVTSRSPWWIDYNHAPPGAGYIHMLFSLNLRGPFSDHHKEIAGPNPFAEQKFPLDFTDARVTVRVRGELELKGAQLVLLVQGRVGETVAGWLLTGQPIHVGPEWSEQTIVAAPDESQWTCLKSRHDRQDFYGFHPLRTILSNVNVNIMLVLFPLEIRPMGEIRGDPHLLRAGRDYPVWTSRLPEGYVQLDTFRIDFVAGGSAS